MQICFISLHSLRLFDTIHFEVRPLTSSTTAKFHLRWSILIQIGDLELEVRGWRSILTDTLGRGGFLGLTCCHIYGVLDGHILPRYVWGGVKLQTSAVRWKATFILSLLLGIPYDPNKHIKTYTISLTKAKFKVHVFTQYERSIPSYSHRLHP